MNDFIYATNWIKSLGRFGWPRNYAISHPCFNMNTHSPIVTVYSHRFYIRTAIPRNMGRPPSLTGPKVMLFPTLVSISTPIAQELLFIALNKIIILYYIQ